MAYASLGDYDAAIAAYKSALNLEPDAADAHYGLEVAYSKQSKWEQAIKEYQQRE
jgi:tetratricopeptide (TPR) repeat protein